MKIEFKHRWTKGKPLTGRQVAELAQKKPYGIVFIEYHYGDKTRSYPDKVFCNGPMYVDLKGKEVVSDHPMMHKPTANLMWLTCADTAMFSINPSSDNPVNFVSPTGTVIHVFEAVRLNNEQALAKMDAFQVWWAEHSMKGVNDFQARKIWEAAKASA